MTMHQPRNKPTGTSAVYHPRLAILAILSLLFSASAFAQDPKLAPEKQTKLEAAIARF